MPVGAKAIAALSIVLWLAIICFGRLIIQRYAVDVSRCEPGAGAAGVAAIASSRRSLRSLSVALADAARRILGADQGVIDPPWPVCRRRRRRCTTSYPDPTTLALLQVRDQHRFRTTFSARRGARRCAAVTLWWPATAILSG
jgi:hypothetical protein